MRKLTLLLAACFLFCVDHVYSQLDSWPVVSINETGNFRNFVIDEAENIYTLSRDGRTEFVTQDSFISFRWFTIFKHNSKGELQTIKDTIDLGNYNNQDLRHKGPTAFTMYYHNNKIYVTGIMRRPVVPTAFVYILNATTLEEVTTHFIEIPDVEEISGLSSGAQLWIHENGILNLYVTISINDQRIYKIEDDDIKMTYQFGFSNFQNIGSFLLNGELYTGRSDVTITKRDHRGGVIITYDFPYSGHGRFLHNEDGVVSIYSPDLLTFTEEGFQQPYFRQEDFNPPLCTSCYTFIDFVRADDGSFLALGYGELINNFVTALHRFYDDGTTDYAFLYDPFYFSMDDPRQIEKISKGFVIAGCNNLNGPNPGCFLTLIDDEGYLITTTEEPPPQSKIPLLLYPNPVISELIMELDEGDFHSGTLEVYNISGQLVHRQEIADFKTVIDVDGLAAGTYILRYISDRDGTQLSGKFVKVND